MAMAASRIIKGIDVIGDVLSRSIPILVDVLFDPFFLQTAKERSGHCVIPTVASAAHAGLEVIGFAEAAPSVASILCALIRVNQCTARSPATHRLEDGIEHELAMNRCA